MIDWELELGRQKALDHCHRVLAAGAKTEQQLREKLEAKAFDDDQVAWALARCREQGLIDDAAYTRIFLQQRSARGHGTRRIRQDLAKRGVPGPTVDEVLADHAPDAEETLERCVELVAKRFEPDALADMKQRAKAFRFLVSRGYDSSHAERAIAQVRAGADE